MQNAECKMQNSKCRMQNYFSILPNFKIVNYEIIFVRNKGAKAEHTWAYVSISLSADSCKKELIRTILLHYSFEQRLLRCSGHKIFEVEWLKVCHILGLALGKSLLGKVCHTSC